MPHGARLKWTHARLAAGDVLLIFGEGTRSRSGELQPMLPGVARYLGAADIVVLPVGLTGSEQLYPVNDTSLRPARVVMTVGAPLSVARLMAAADGERRVAMDAIGLSIANLLPASATAASTPLPTTSRTRAAPCNAANGMNSVIPSNLPQPRLASLTATHPWPSHHRCAHQRPQYR